MPTQPQEKPRGHAMLLCKAICRTIERENKKRGMRIKIPAILRSIEWTRYCITEAYMEQLEQAAGEAGCTSFTPVNSRKGNAGKGM